MTDKKEDKPLAMTHYCEGKWIDGIPADCSAGVLEEMHPVRLAKLVTYDD